MQFRILGPMEARVGDQSVGLGGPKQRATLAFLLLQANQVVATSRLLHALWPVDKTPTTARKILHNAVCGLRGVLTHEDGARGADSTALLTRPPGYMLRVDPDLVDLHLFERLAESGRERLAGGAPEEATRMLREALELWRGPALVDLIEAGIEWPELASLQSDRLDVLEDYFEAQLACGRHHRVLSELEAMVKAEPLRERACGQLMLALYRCGRQADALNLYQRTREDLVESLGLEPGQGLRQLQQAILTQDPMLSLGGARSPYAPFDEVARGGTGEPVTLMTPTPTPDCRKPGGQPRTAAGPTAAASPVRRGRGEARPGGNVRRKVAVMAVRVTSSEAPGEGGGAAPDAMQDGAAAVVRQQVMSRGGTLMASLGPLSLALFGLTASSPDDAREAVQAALAIRDALGVPPGPGPHRPRLVVHAAVHMGAVMVRWPEGATVPIVAGSALEECQALLFDAAAGEVRVSEGVRRLAGDNLSFVRADGTSDGWLAGTGKERERSTDGPEPVRMGPELGVLQGLLGLTLCRSLPHLVTVLGGPGTGKSLLLREFERQATTLPEGPVVLSGRVSATHEDPLAAPAQMLCQYCGLRPGDSAGTAWSRLAETVRSLFGSARTAGWTLARLVPLVDPDSESRCGGTPTEVAVAWREFFQAAAARRPVVLAFDDLQHADDSVLDAVEELAQCVGPVPLFIVATASPRLLLRRRSWAGGSSRSTTVALDGSPAAAVVPDDRLPLAVARR